MLVFDNFWTFFGQFGQRSFHTSVDRLQSYFIASKNCIGESSVVFGVEGASYAVCFFENGIQKVFTR